MANDPKSKNDKTKAAQPVIDAASTETAAPPATPEPVVAAAPTALATAPAEPARSAPGLVIPTIAEVEALELVSREKLAALTALLEDPAFTDIERSRLRGIIEQANPVKEGMEEVVTTWSVPRIQIAQPTTQSSAKPENAKQGAMYTTQGTLLETPFQFIPFYFNPENIMFEQGQKAPTCFAPDAKLGQPYGLCSNCVHLPFGQQNGGRGEQKKTDCQNQIVVGMLAYDLSQVYICQFGKTSRGAGSALTTLCKTQPKPYTQSYLLSTEKKTGDVGTYFVYKIEPTGKTNPENVQRMAGAVLQLFQANRKRFLADYYLKAGSAGVTAALAETEFNRNKLAAGLDAGDAGEPDLSPPPATSSVRSASKPM